MSKLEADHPDAGTINDPNVEDPYADLKARNDATDAVAQKAATDRAKGKGDTDK